jgi:hypothetical protein
MAFYNLLTATMMTRAPSRQLQLKGRLLQNRKKAVVAEVFEVTSLAVAIRKMLHRPR